MTRLALAALLALPAVAAAEPFVQPGDTLQDVHVRLDTDATWGIASQMTLGAIAHAQVQLPVWNSAGATGSFDPSLRIVYANEPVFLAPWVDPETSTPVQDRILIQGGIGHTFHATPKRRLSFGLHAMVGWQRWIRDITIHYDTEDVQGREVQVLDYVTITADVTLAYRISKNVGVNLTIGAPMPTATTPEIGMVHLGVGLSWYLR